MAAITSSRLYGVARGGRSPPMRTQISASTPRMQAASGEIFAGLGTMPEAGRGAHIGGASAPNGLTFQPPIAPNPLATSIWIA